jgi:hypothetical protein
MSLPAGPEYAEGDAHHKLGHLGTCTRLPHRSLGVRITLRHREPKILFYFILFWRDREEERVADNHQKHLGHAHDSVHSTAMLNEEMIDSTRTNRRVRCYFHIALR